jgi:glycerol uptake facilitator-like aquaporin
MTIHPIFHKSLCWSQFYISVISAFAGSAVAAIVFRISNPDDK